MLQYSPHYFIVHLVPHSLKTYKTGLWNLPQVQRYLFLNLPKSFIELAIRNVSQGEGLLKSLRSPRNLPSNSDTTI